MALTKQQEIIAGVGFLAILAFFAFSKKEPSGEEAKVEITISDLLGKEVKSFLVSHKTPGYHSVVWNGKDNQDRSVSTGVYLYRIQMGDFLQTKKMVLLR